MIKFLKLSPNNSNLKLPKYPIKVGVLVIACQHANHRLIPKCGRMHASVRLVRKNIPVNRLLRSCSEELPRDLRRPEEIEPCRIVVENISKQ